MVDHVAVRRGKMFCWLVADEGFRQPVEVPRSSETFWRLGECVGIGMVGGR